MALSRLEKPPLTLTGDLIDLVLTDKPANFSVFNQIASGLSNHDIIFGTFTGPDLHLEMEKKTGRNYSTINVQNLRVDIRASSLNDIFGCTDVNSMVEIFNNILVELLDKHAPVTLYKLKTGINSTRPWYTTEIDKASIDRDLAKRNLKREKTPANRKLYNTLRNKVNQMITTAKE